MITITTPMNVVIAVSAVDGQVRMTVADGALKESRGISFPVDDESTYKLIRALEDCRHEADKQR